MRCRSVRALGAALSWVRPGAAERCERLPQCFAAKLVPSELSSRPVAIQSWIRRRTM